MVHPEPTDCLKLLKTNIVLNQNLKLPIYNHYTQNCLTWQLCYPSAFWRGPIYKGFCAGLDGTVCRVQFNKARSQCVGTGDRKERSLVNLYTRIVLLQAQHCRCLPCVHSLGRGLPARLHNTRSGNRQNSSMQVK